MLRIITLCSMICLMSSPLLAKEQSFSDIIFNVVESIDRQLQNKYGSASRYIPIIVTTPVNINNFSQTNALARQIGQEVITQLVQRRYKVEEIRHAKEITSFVDIGEFILSRGKVTNATYSIGFVVAGTYTPTGTGIRFTAEVINVNDSSIAAMESATLPFTQEIEVLLVQQSTRQPTQTNTPNIEVTQQEMPIAPSTVFTVPNDLY